MEAATAEHTVAVKSVGWRRTVSAPFQRSGPTTAPARELFGQQQQEQSRCGRRLVAARVVGCSAKRGAPGSGWQHNNSDNALDVGIQAARHLLEAAPAADWDAQRRRFHEYQIVD